MVASPPGMALLRSGVMATPFNYLLLQGDRLANVEGTGQRVAQSSREDEVCPPPKGPRDEPARLPGKSAGGGVFRIFRIFAHFLQIFFRFSKNVPF